ncbi:TPA: hypothetical protein IAA91_01565 [Candidatus Avacholeplasma faecigallinarum]|nr:hypothetical protein [Candidatus Avacholeplasma faecigallinarum]
MRIKTFIKLCVLSLICLFALASCGKSYDYILYVSPDGDAEAKGSSNDPLMFSVAVAQAKPGMTILMEGGTYSYSARLQIMNSGSPNKYITVMPKNDEDVIFDFSDMIFDSNNRGIQIYGDFWHFKEISVTGAGDNGLYVAGSYNIIENCLFYNNRDTGLQLGRAYSSDVSINTWPSFNLIKNCTSFANYDAETLGENADGFACKLTAGYGNVFDGCIAFRNSDDGWDLYAKEDSGNIGTVVLYNCVSFENGYLPYQIELTNDEDGSKYMSYNTINGDGIGFKLGGSVMEGDVILNNCMAFNNKLHGFGDNSNPGVIDINNCTAFNNCVELDENGNVAGRDTNGGKSNNIDLARATSGVSNSYNNYYGIVSYINNQANFVANDDSSDDEDMTYNTDKFRGSAAYSIFNSSYDKNSKTEKYVAFTAPEDASSYVSKAVDSTFSSGTTYTGLSDASFASLESINAKCDTVDDLADLVENHLTLRNPDGSVNMGDTLRIVDETLLTFANGKAIGANLSKSSDAEYEHYDVLDFSNCKTATDVRLQATYNVTEVLTNPNSVFQDFEVPKLVNGCDISWESSNKDIVEVVDSEKISTSDAVYSQIKIYTPQQDTEVKLTATISYGGQTKVKEFNLIIKARAQALGGIAIEGDTSIKVEKFGTYVAPRVYALDLSAIGTRELPLSLYDVTYTYKFAQSKADTMYDVDGISTAVPGVYEVKATVTSKIEGDVDNLKRPNTASLVYYVYILDKDCIIDFMENDNGVQTGSIILTSDGYSVGGNLSNLYGDLYSVYSATPLTLTAMELMNHEDVQIQAVENDSILLPFSAGELAGEAFYGYYVIANKNRSYISQVYSFQTNVVEITTNEQFNQVAVTGKLDGVSASSTTIYKLMNDLDFNNTWNTSLNKSTFSGLLNGNGHTVKNVTISSSAKDDTDMFYKVQNGSIININFENINIENTSTGGKVVGIIGKLQGGYLHKISMKNVSVKGYERVGALVGQAIGGYNYITNCQLNNDEGVVIAARNKYASGLIGEAEVESSITDKTLYISITNCSVVANLGDGNDSGGCIGGMIGRVKADYDTFTIIVINCYYRGTIVAKGNYNAGMVGDISNGSATVTISGCFSDAVFMYKGTLLDISNLVPEEDTQKYAHKNSNPICGRATYTENVGSYTSENNLGTWSEYYSSLIDSTSILFDMSYTNEETNEFYRWTVTEDFIKNIGFDLENTWIFSDGKLALR